MEHWGLSHRKMFKDILMIFLVLPDRVSALRQLKCVPVILIVFDSIIFHLDELESCARSSKHTKAFFPTFPDWRNNDHYYFIIWILFQIVNRNVGLN